MSCVAVCFSEAPAAGAHLEGLRLLSAEPLEPHVSDTMILRGYYWLVAKNWDDCQEISKKMDCEFLCSKQSSEKFNF